MTGHTGSAVPLLAGRTDAGPRPVRADDLPGVDACRPYPPSTSTPTSPSPRPRRCSRADPGSPSSAARRRHARPGVAAAEPAHIAVMARSSPTWTCGWPRWTPPASTCRRSAPPRCARVDRPGLADPVHGGVNEAVAAFCARQPDRLLPIGTVALHHPDLAVEQLATGGTDLGVRGVQISTTAGPGRELDDPRWPSSGRPPRSWAPRCYPPVGLHPGGAAERLLPVQLGRQPDRDRARPVPDRLLRAARAAPGPADLVGARRRLPGRATSSARTTPGRRARTRRRPGSRPRRCCAARTSTPWSTPPSSSATSSR